MPQKPKIAPEKVLEAYEAHGSHRAAAKALGIAQSSVSYLLNQIDGYKSRGRGRLLPMSDEQRATIRRMASAGHGRDAIAQATGLGCNQIRQYLNRNPVALGSEHAPAPNEQASKLVLARARVKTLERELETATRRLEQERKRKIGKLPKVKRRPVGGHVRVIIPDSHGCHIDEAARDAFLADLKSLAPAEIVMLGDHVDCGGFLAQHHALMYTQSVLYSYEDDIAAANEFLDQIQAAAPGATIHYLSGNHEERVASWCIKHACGNHSDAVGLLKRNAPEFLLGLAERGIKHYGRHRRYDGVAVTGAIKLGECYFVHGISHAKNAAKAHVERFGGNVVFGHTHRQQSHSMNLSGPNTTYTAWSVGCLAKLDRDYQKHMPHDWRLGYGVQFVGTSGQFQHVTVSIIDGVSLLEPLLQRVR